MVLVLGGAACAAGNDREEASFCKYIQEQATAQRDLLLSPSLTAGPVQPSIGTAPQFVLGFTNSLANLRKAKLTMETVQANCRLYAATTEAEQRVLYDLPSLEKDALAYRLELIATAEEKLAAMERENEKLLAVQNLTRSSAHYIRSARFRLETSRAAAVNGIASISVPPLNPAPMRSLVQEKMASEEKSQKAIVHLAKQNAWDVQLGGGFHRQLGQFTPDSSRLGAFGEVTITYNLARWASNRRYDNSVNAYLDWKSNQFDDVAHQASVLKKQVEENIRAQQDHLRVLLTQDESLEAEIRSLDGLDTTNALTFRNQLTADRTLLQVDIGESQFRLQRLRQYLTDNF